MKTSLTYKYLSTVYLLPLFFVFSGITFNVQAAIVQGLYESEMLVANQSRSGRDKAMKTALLEVLAKVSGRPDVNTMANIASALNKPSLYLQQYQYRKIPENSYLLTEAAAGSQLIWFRFDEKAVNKLLQSNRLPVWGRTRPATLVWLAVEQDGERFLIGGNSQEEIRFAIEKEAKRRGVAVLLPLLDLEDQTKLNLVDVLNNSQEAIFQASARYQADAILVGRISLTGDNAWQGRWILYEGGQGLSWNAQGTYSGQLVSTGVTGALEILGSRYAQVYDNTTPGVFDIAVMEIRSLEQFARVSRYLKSLEQVKALYPTYINNQSVTYRLDIRGNSTGLIQTFALGNVLATVSDPFENRAMNNSSVTSFATDQTIEVQETLPSTAHIYRLIP
ncbi:MAG: DUF2066 domain-containing protein [Gammaproteobacteria bacterium]|nr:DUF2066 domain-containing protein [Gammaproteobacteria bacterium]